MESEINEIIDNVNGILNNIEEVMSSHKYSEPNETAVSMISMYCIQLYSYETYVAENAADILSLAKKYYGKKAFKGDAPSIKVLILNHTSGIRSYLEAAKQYAWP